MAPFLGLSALGVLANGLWLIQTPSLGAATLLLLSFAALSFFCHLFFTNFSELLICRIVPYFERKPRDPRYVPDFTMPHPLFLSLPRADAFERGIDLAKQCKPLDLLATQIGVKPLSTFGFRDDRDWQRLIWHDPADGIETVVRLIDAVQQDERLRGTLTDLGSLFRALETARRQGVRFCLLIRPGLDKLISPVEMDGRVGTFWPD